MTVEQHTIGDQKHRQIGGSRPAAAFPPGLAAPAIRALIGAGYSDLRHLAGVPAADLQRLHGMGPRALVRLQQALEREGLSLG